MNASTIAASVVATVVISLGVLATYTLVLVATSPKRRDIQNKEEDVE